MLGLLSGLCLGLPNRVFSQHFISISYFGTNLLLVWKWQVSTEVTWQMWRHVCRRIVSYVLVQYFIVLIVRSRHKLAGQSAVWDCLPEPFIRSAFRCEYHRHKRIQYTVHATTKVEFLQAENHKYMFGYTVTGIRHTSRVLFIFSLYSTPPLLQRNFMTCVRCVL
jgi:hypothetical protein